MVKKITGWTLRMLNIEKLNDISDYWIAWIWLAVCSLGFWASVELAQWLNINFIAVMGMVSFGGLGILFGFMIFVQSLNKVWKFLQEDSSVRPKRKTYWKSFIATSILLGMCMFSFEITWAYFEKTLVSTFLFLMVYAIALSIEYQASWFDKQYINRFSPLAIFVGIASVMAYHSYEITAVFTDGLVFFIGFLLTYTIVAKVEKLIRRRFDPYTPEEDY